MSGRGCRREEERKREVDGRRETGRKTRSRRNEPEK